MGHPFILQDWTTLTASTGLAILQPEADYLDLAGYQDVAVYLDIADLSVVSGPRVAIQTSPTRDDVMFLTMHEFTPSAAGLQTPVPVVRWASAAVPLARWTRWSCTLGSGTSVAFRIWLNANPAGGR